MTPLFRTALRRIARRPLQYVLFIVGVALGVAMMVSITLANGSASKAFALSTDTIAGKATHRLVGGPTGFDEALYVALRTEVGYRKAAPVVEGIVNAPLLGAQSLQLLGIDPLAEPPFRNYLGNSADPALLSNFLLSANGVILSADLARTADLQLGDPLPIVVAGRSAQLQVVGLIESADPLTRNGLQEVLITDIATAQILLGRVGRLSHIDLIADDDQELAPITALLPPDVRLEATTARSNALRQMTAAFELNLTALSLLALVVGMFLIYNTVTFSVIQRRPIFGILRCLGVTGRQLGLLIIGEATVLGFIGSLIGAGIGVALGRGMVRLVTQTINDLYFTVNVREVALDPNILFRGVLLGVLVAVVASAVPALEAIRTPPTSTLRRSVLEGKTAQRLPYLLLSWALLSGLGVILLRTQRGGLLTSFGGLFAVLFAFALLTPPVTVWFLRLITPFTERIGGVLGRIAPRDIIRSLSRTSVAIAALMLSVSVVVGLSIMIGSFRQTVVQWLEQTLQADIYISPPNASSAIIDGSLDPRILSLAANHPDYAEGMTARTVNLFVPQWQSMVNLAALSGETSRGTRPYLWADGEYAQTWARMLAGEGVVISEPLLRKQKLALPPEPIILPTNQGDRAFPVLAVVYDYSSDQGVIWIGDKAYREGWGDEGVSSLAVFVSDSADVDQVVSDLQTQFAPVQAVTVRSNLALRQNSLAIFDRTFAITAALRLLATVVAFIGVLSALLSLQLERTRELATLRATGMTRTQLRNLTLWETGLMGTIAGLLAMPTGYVLAWILIYVINLRSFGWTLQMQLQPSYFLQALTVSVISALLAGLYPAWQIGRMVIASALRSE